MTLIPMILSSLLAVAGLVQCSSKQSAQPVQGVQGTGGGSIQESTPEQVNEAIDKALELATEPDAQLNVFVRFWQQSGSLSKLDFISRPARIFPNFVSRGAADRFESPELSAFKPNKIVRLTAGDCPHPPSEKNADASVSEFDLHATICFSIGNLTRVPPGPLLRYVLALVLHEASHLGGADEPDAQAWQHEFEKYAGSYYGDMQTDDVTAKTYQILSEARGLLLKARGKASVNACDDHIPGIFGTMAQKISELPYYNDETALRLKLNPRHAERMSAYTQAADDFVSQVKTMFVNKLKPVTDGPDDCTLEGLKVNKALPDYADDLDKISDSFEALTQN